MLAVLPVRSQMPYRAAQRAAPAAIRWQTEQRAMPSRHPSGYPAETRVVGLMVFDPKGRLVKADAAAQGVLAEIGVQIDCDPRLRIDALDATGSGAERNPELPDWLDPEWIEPVLEGGERLGTVVHMRMQLKRNASAAKGGLPAYKLRRVMDFVEAHIDEPMRLEQLAAAVAVSPFHFHRQFKSSTGLTPHQYIVRVRMERAKALLSGSDLPLAEVAAQVGFADQSYFTSAFRRTTSLTPRSYRNAVHENRMKRT